ncbi:MAG: hypothetical protein JW861_10735 [Bacteroidales bacterium]|nr:hypothetical protein [Bacteroidales bacterium]
MFLEVQLAKAAEAIRKSSYTVAFTGAGVSVESGIPPFRGVDGIWSRYDPRLLEINHFYEKPVESWSLIRDIFYSYFKQARFNRAHEVLARMEAEGLLGCVITQNIDNLHQEAGSRCVYEFHGNSKRLICTRCGESMDSADVDFENIPPYCSHCHGLLKPDFIFFGEGIPPAAFQGSVDAANRARTLIIIGSTGEVMPASQMPYIAKQSGAVIIEVNIEPSRFTSGITDIFLEGKATYVMDLLAGELFP